MEPDLDVLIIGAGISGISMAAHIGLICPDRSYAILERRAQIGGTWDLFRYPGVRSDSDMHTLGFVFEPWRHKDAIADGPAILEYLERTARERGIFERIRFNTTVLAADWDEVEAVWTVTSRGLDGADTITRARWLYFASGYYDYDNPHDAALPGIGNFSGKVVHPQFWPSDLNYAGKRVVVIGSGATAVTIVPIMAEQAAEVVMLQRTPTWMAAGPRQDRWNARFLKVLPEKWAYWLTRQKNIALRTYFFRLSRRNPERLSGMLRNMLRQHLGDAYEQKHFEPPYTPWKQRLCLVPEGDLFEAIKAGRARIVTDHIETFDERGIRLKSGEYIEADLVVTATGLRLALGGKVAVSRGGVPVDFSQHYFYRGAMFSNIANMSVVFGYLNASWTLRADNTAAFVARILAHMRRTGSAMAIPQLAPGDEPPVELPFDYTSGYLQRAAHIMPKSGPALPWRLNHDYLADRRDFRTNPVSDGVLRFTNPTSSKEQAA